MNAADALLANGAKEVYAYISHGVLSGGAAARIAGSRLKELVITNSILPTEAVTKAANIRTLSIAPPDRGSDQPHRVGRIGVEPVRLRQVSRRVGKAQRAHHASHESVPDWWARCALPTLRDRHPHSNPGRGTKFISMFA